MKPARLFPRTRTLSRSVTMSGIVTLGALAALCLRAENTNSMYRPHQAVAGGLDPHPYIHSVEKAGDAVTLRWQGFQGPYQVQKKATVSDPAWLNLGAPTHEKSATLSSEDGAGLLQIEGAYYNYAGAAACRPCHTERHADWSLTRHAGAFQTLKRIGQGANADCLPCHTVGYGSLGGFVSETASLKLAGVQCENCHGPAATHIATGGEDPTVIPVKTIAAEICGGCHTDAHHPTYDEWEKSKHAEVTEDVAASILSSGEPRMLACGPCHSGAVRTALLNQLEAPEKPLPSRADAAHFGVTCVVCHDPHQKGGEQQLRNPKFSTADFSYSTSTNTTFRAQYDPQIQLCGQCHNMRGAKATDGSRPPHHSPQYNVLIGKGAYDWSDSRMTTHGNLGDQCVHCHVPQIPVPAPVVENPNYTGHTFAVKYSTCVAAECHDSQDSAQGLVELIQRSSQERIAVVKGLLDQWALDKAPESLRSKYGRLAWEYQNVGAISNPSGAAGVVGPGASGASPEQNSIPLAIKQARFNLYLAQYDASFGVHNRFYTFHIINVARTNVLNELSAP